MIDEFNIFAKNSRNSLKNSIKTPVFHAIWHKLMQTLNYTFCIFSHYITNSKGKKYSRRDLKNKNTHTLISNPTSFFYIDRINRVCSEQSRAYIKKKEEVVSESSIRNEREGVFLCAVCLDYMRIYAHNRGVVIG